MEAELAGPRPDDSAGGTVPGWLGTLAGISWRVLVIAALAWVLLALAMLLGTVSAAVLVAVLVAAFFVPLDERLRARGMAPTKAASVTSVVALVGALVVALLLVLAFAPAVAELVRHGNEGIDELAAQLTALGFSPTAVHYVTEFIDAFGAWVSELLGTVVSRLGDLTTVLILGGFLTFFLLQDGDRAWGGVARELAGSHYDDLTYRAQLALDRVGRYLRGMFVLAAIDAVSDLVFLAVLGVPLAGPLAVLVFLGGFIPYLGAVFTVSVLALVTWATQGLGAVALLLLLIVITNVVLSVAVAPRLYGTTPRIPPALIVVALPAGATLFGILGLIVAVPIVAAAATLLPAAIAMLSDDPPPGRAPTLVPLWLDRLAQWGWRVLTVIGALGLVIVALLQVPIVTMPAILAGVLAATLRPVMQRLRAAGLSLTASAAGATVGSATVVGVVLAFTVVSIAGSASDIVARASEGAASSGLGSAPVDLVGEVGSAMTFNVATLVANLAGIVLIGLMVALLTFFLLRNGSGWLRMLLEHIPADRQASVSSVVSNTGDILSGYMVGTGSIALFAGVTQWLMMALLGLPLALPIGVLTFFLSFIPYIGDLIATVLGFLVALAVGSTTDIILMGVFTIVINIVQGNIVAPLVYRRTVSLHPAIVLMAAPAGAAVGGMMGMFLVVPFLGIIASTWRTAIHLFDPQGVAPTSASAPAAQPAGPGSLGDPVPDGPLPASGA
jgi:predicted PurR-regulated permease PerM